MNTNYTKITIYTCLLLINTNITPQDSNPNRTPLIEHFFRIIETNNHETLQQALDKPHEFPQRFNCNYTAEEL